jgi:hypothetical protein
VKTPPPPTPTPEERIQELARRSAIDAGAAERLLAAVRPEPIEKAGWNPFARYGAPTLLAAGAVGVAVWIACARFGMRGQGALDVFTSHAPVPFAVAALDQVADIGALSLLLWGAARIFVRDVRFVDLLATVGLARLVLGVSSIPIAIATYLAPKGAATQTLGEWVGVAIGLSGWGVHLWALVAGFRTATGLRGGRFVGTFFPALLVAEVVTKVIAARLAP